MPGVDMAKMAWIYVNAPHGKSLWTFWSFDEFDLDDSLQHGFSPAYVESNNWASHLECLHGPAVGNLGHVHFIHMQDTVIHPADTHAELDRPLLHALRL